MSETNNPISIDDGIPEVSFNVEVAQVIQTPVDDTLSIAGMAADAKATGDAINAAKAELQEEIDAVDTDIDAVPGTIFPVGSIYISTSSSPPTFGGANWQWQEILIPVTYGDLMSGARNYSSVGAETPGTLHLWLRLPDAEVNA